MALVVATAAAAMAGAAPKASTWGRTYTHRSTLPRTAAAVATEGRSRSTAAAVASMQRRRRTSPPPRRGESTRTSAAASADTAAEVRRPTAMARLAAATAASSPSSSAASSSSASSSRRRNEGGYKSNRSEPTTTEGEVYPSRAARVRAERKARHIKNIGPDGGSRNSRSAVQLCIARETCAIAGGVDALTQRALALWSGGAGAGARARNGKGGSGGNGDGFLEVASHLLDAAALVAEDDVYVALQALELSAAIASGEKAPYWGKGTKSRRTKGVRAGVNGASTASPPSGKRSVRNGNGDKNEEAIAEEEEAALLRAYASRDAARAACDTVAARLSSRLVLDEWLATIAAFASTDFYQEKKKPRVRPKDRRCNQPKDRQGWNKRAMREVRVRVCAGCDRMLPAHALIRITRLKKVQEEVVADAAGAKGGTSSGDGGGGGAGGKQSLQQKKTSQKQQRKRAKNKYNVAVDPSTLTFRLRGDTDDEDDESGVMRTDTMGKQSDAADVTLLDMVSPGGVAEAALGGDPVAIAEAAAALYRRRLDSRAGAGVVGDRDGAHDWDCGACGCVNFARRTACFRCGAGDGDAGDGDGVTGAGAARDGDGVARVGAAAGDGDAGRVGNETSNTGDEKQQRVDTPQGTTAANGAPRWRARSKLQGRATYVCRRGFCARRAVTKGAVAKSLGSSAGAQQNFGDALTALCEEAERLEGVDSERWDVVREMGSSSRWSAHPVVVDQETREVIPEGDATWMVFMK